MRQLETDLNYISSLPDKPAMATADLKREFDKAGNAIKTFINNTLEPDITQDMATMQSSIAGQITALQTYVDSELSDLQDSVEQQLQALSDEISGTVTTQINKKTSYDDFATTVIDITLSTDMQYGTSTVSKSATAQNYKPLGVVGWYKKNTNNGDWNVYWARMSASSNGNVTVQGYGQSIPNHGNVQTSCTLSVTVLWVKIK